MTQDEIDRALAALAPEAVAVVERALRAKGRTDRTQIDTAWKVLTIAGRVGGAVEEEEVAELANVLRVVGP